ncbi:MAG: hypothetical protein JRJ09_10770, partial [Deltaproteobacteria bacterium]|nr:hypothetical protein [Deltaproteobacteria bacterium]MBW2048990.1 hypothetical protein [Deltaproteobacteria bacterium]
MNSRKKMNRAFRVIPGLVAAVVFLLSTVPAGAGEDLKPQILVDQAL